MQCKVSHHICYGFRYSPENFKKLSRKNKFVALFQRFFNYALLRSVSYAPTFCQMKGLMKIHNCDKFHQCNICGCQVINFPMFSWQCSIHEMAFLGPNSLKYCQILLNTSTDVVFKETQTVFEEFWKN